jgi:membrane protease subunit (stomatin/prohibitin family)
MHGIAWGENGVGFTKSIQSAFRPLISTAVKAHLSNAIKSNNINILEIDENLETLSEIMRQSIIGGFEEYGLTIPQFYITNIALPENDPNFKRMKELHTISFQTRMIQADALVRSAQADAEAEVTVARRKIELEKQLTETEVAKREAERDLIRAQAEAQAAKMAGFAEAEVMRAKGYDGKDVLTAEVQKAYAEGLGNMTINGGGGVAGDMIGLGVGMAAAGAVAPQLGEMFKVFSTPTPTTSTAETESKCAKCGASLPQNAKFCLECGEKVVPAVPTDMIVCPECGNTVAKGKFCPECGHKFITVCPKCGKDLVPGAKFCLECGEKL